MQEYAGRYLDAVLTDENGNTLTMKVLVTKANDESPFGMEMASSGPIKTTLAKPIPMADVMERLSDEQRESIHQAVEKLPFKKWEVIPDGVEFVKPSPEDEKAISANREMMRAHSLKAFTPRYTRQNVTTSDETMAAVKNLKVEWGGTVSLRDVAEAERSAMADDDLPKPDVIVE